MCIMLTQYDAGIGSVTYIYTVGLYISIYIYRYIYIDIYTVYVHICCSTADYHTVAPYCGVTAWIRGHEPSQHRLL